MPVSSRRFAVHADRARHNRRHEKKPKGRIHCPEVGEPQGNPIRPTRARVSRYPVTPAHSVYFLPSIRTKLGCQPAACLPQEVVGHLPRSFFRGRGVGDRTSWQVVINLVVNARDALPEVALPPTRCRSSLLPATRRGSLSDPYALVVDPTGPAEMRAADALYRAHDFVVVERGPAADAVPAQQQFGRYLGIDLVPEKMAGQ